MSLPTKLLLPSYAPPVRSVLPSNIPTTTFGTSYPTQVIGGVLPTTFQAPIQTSIVPTYNTQIPTSYV